MAEEALYEDLSDMNSQWEEICSQLKVEFGETAVNSWLKPLRINSFDNGVVNISAPTIFMRNWVIAHYAERIHRIMERKNPEIKQVQFVVKNTASGGNVSSLSGSGHLGDGSLTKRIQKSPTPQNIYGLNNTVSYNDNESVSSKLNPAYTFENFVVGKTNEFAYAAARKVAESRNITFNPLFLYSGVGLGKTHLMHAVAQYIKQNDPKRTVVYISAEQFLQKFVNALRYRDTDAFKEMFRTVDVLMIDDVQFLANKTKTQDEFFYTFNSLIEGGKQIILSADKSPNDLEGIENRLKSRLNSGLVADIMPTDFELRLGILRKKSELLGIKLPNNVAEFLAQKISSNIRELEGSLKRIIAHSQLLSGNEITIDMTQEVLKDILHSIDRKTTIDEIQKRVAEYFNISVKEMQSSRRARNVARPRQIAMYLAKHLTSRSLPEIGRKFDRDHTTVMHAVRKVEELIVEDTSMAESIESLRRSLEG
ncbi:MAG: chromosomal replication initiator protein DnaA [Alphaproteobacteria bacterium]|nr:chromosomal replication initiator protein DnaA [Alphaproteobacteria bacterium]